MEITHPKEETKDKDLDSACLARRARAVLIGLLALFVSVSAAQKPVTEVPKESRRQVRPKTRSSSHPAGLPQCETKGEEEEEEEIVITCTYLSGHGSVGKNTSCSRIALNRAVLSFRPDDSSNMLAKLTLTNMGTARILDERTVYLAIDDDAGNNYVRRALPTVDLRKLSPGKAITFSEQLRVAAFPPGRYTIALWIPSSEEALKFDPAHNLLICEAGVVDPQAGLNILAKFAVGNQH